MTDATAPVTPGAGELIDVESLVVATLTVLRQRMQIAGANAAEIARVENVFPSAGDMGLVVRTMQLPAALGQTTKSASLPVTIASDQPVALDATVAAVGAKLPTVTAGGAAPGALFDAAGNPVAVVLLEGGVYGVRMHDPNTHDRLDEVRVLLERLVDLQTVATQENLDSDDEKAG